MTCGTTSRFLAAAVAAVAMGCRGDAAPAVVPSQEVVVAVPVGTGDPVQDEVAAFYSRRANAPAWVAGEKLAGPEDVLAVVRSAPDHGLAAADYVDEALARIVDADDDVERQFRDDRQALARLDLQLTTALLALGRDVALGRDNPTGIRPSWKKRRAAPDLAATLADAAGHGGLARWLDRVRPRHPEYAALQQALAGIGRTPAAPGAVDARAETIASNMERWRWMPDDLGARHILVNLPAYVMAVRENGVPVLEMKVIVGRRAQATPIFSDQLETVVFSPYWNVPDGIAASETVPAAARDPGFLRRQNMEVLRRTARGTERVEPESVDWNDPDAIKGLAFRQRPGPNNALGRVKFLLPNPYDVYLHDTPARNLFARQVRALSHGCIRLERPEELARYVLRDKPEWTADRIRKAMHAGQETHVALQETLPVHLVYFTAWPSGNGDVELFDDVYRYDATQLAARRGAAARPANRR